MKPLFWNFNGLLDNRLCKYTAVLTPHFLERLMERGNRIGDTHFRSLVPKFWIAALPDKICGTELDKSFIYFRRQFNKRRKRWELEFISITPNRNFHTQKLSHAVKVEI